MAASWNAGIFPVATVSTDSSDHIRIAVSPISVAARGVMGSHDSSSVMAGLDARPSTSFSLDGFKDVDARDISPGMTTFYEPLRHATATQ